MTMLHFISDIGAAPKKQRDMESLVCVIGKKENYTESEIAKLEDFARAHMEWDNRLGEDKTHAYYIFFEKRADGTWLRKKESWTQGPLVSPTLEDALAFMCRAYGLRLEDPVRAVLPPGVVRLREGYRA